MRYNLLLPDSHLKSWIPLLTLNPYQNLITVASIIYTDFSDSSVTVNVYCFFVFSHYIFSSYFSVLMLEGLYFEQYSGYIEPFNLDHTLKILFMHQSFSEILFTYIIALMNFISCGKAKFKDTGTNL